ncbi:MAG: cation:proton antiporter [Prochloraceae cyanobacterium]
MTSPFLATEIAILILLLIASLGSIYFQRLFKLPYTVGLVIVGLLLGFSENLGLPLKHLILSPDSILFLFVPPLVFASASNINHRLFFHNIVPAFTLAGPGLLISTAIIGGILNFLTPLNLGQAMLFGSLISATDPVAVVALFEELGVPQRLNMMVDAESMLNDATAIVAFEVVLSVLNSGAFNAATVGEALIQVAIVLVGGIVVGLLVGSLMGFSIRLAKDNPLVQATFSLLVAYLAFIVAEHYLEVSGVIAVLTAGLMVGRYKAYNLSVNLQDYLNEFWEYVSFLANSLIFLLVGLTSSSFILTLPLTQLSFWIVIVCTIAVTYLARGIMVFGLISLINPFLKDGPISWRYSLVSFWGGLRGAVALALALSLPNDFPNRNLLIAMTLGVALFTILVGGLTTGKLLNRLGLDRPPLVNQISEQQALLAAKKRVIEQLNDLETRALLLSTDIVKALAQAYQSEVTQAQISLDDFNERLRQQSVTLNTQVLWLEIVDWERQIYTNFYESGVLSARTLNWLKFYTNLRQARIEEGKFPPPHFPLDYSRPAWKNFLVNLVRRFSPNSSWLQREEDLELESDYEFKIVVSKKSEIIIDRLENAVQKGVIASELAENCLKYYQFTQEKASNRLETLANQNPALDNAIQQRLVKQTALVEVQEQIKEMVNEGLINREMAEKISENITQSLSSVQPESRTLLA